MIENEKLSRLYDLKELSYRAFHICEANQLLNAEDLLGYFQEHGSFRQFRSLGAKTNLELIRHCDEYLAAKNEIADAEATFLDNLEPETSPVPQSTAVALTPDQQQFLDGLTSQMFQSLSFRARNCLNYYLGNHIDFASINRFFPKGSNTLDFYLPSASEKTKTEIHQFVKKVIHLRDRIAETDEIEAKEVQFKSWMNYAYSLEQMAPQVKEDSYRDGQLRLFQLLDALIDSGKVFKKNGTIIFRKRFGYYEGIPVHELQDIGQEIGLTMERVRRIACKLPQQLADCLQNLSTLSGSFDLVDDYGWALGADLFFVTPECAQAVSKAEQVRFSQRFYTLYLWLQAKGTYEILPVEIHGEKYDFLVKSDLHEVFKFPRFLSDSQTLIIRKYRRSYFMDFGEYVASFLKGKENGHLLPRLEQVCRELLLAQYKEAVPFDADGNLAFENPKVGPILLELVYQLLDSENRPMHLKEIYERLKDHPDYLLKCKGVSIRPYIASDNDRFQFYDRGTYGLRKWEAQPDSIRSGTIPSIVEEYLKKHDIPKHISEITTFVQQYRSKTNQKSILANLCQPTNNRKVRQFLGGYWGLYNKQYEAHYYPHISRPRSIKDVLIKFIEQNGEVAIGQLMAHFTETLQMEETELDPILEKMLQKRLIRLTADGTVQLTAPA